MNIMFRVRNSIIVGAILLLTGCSSGPRIIEANIPLISKNSTIITEQGSIIPLRYNSLLASKNTTYLPQDKYDSIVVDKIYVSALGEQCRKLKVKHNDRAFNRIACKKNIFDQKEQWYLVNNIVSNSPILML